MNNDIQSISDAYNKARHDAMQWFQCFNTLAELRNRLLRELDGRCFVQYDAEQVELIEEAAKQLSWQVGKANKKREELNADVERLKAVLFPPTISDEAIRELGERMAANPQSISTNIEGSAYLAHINKIDHENIAKDGCCGRVPDSSGYCYGVGSCPRFHEAESAVSFCNDYVKWTENAQEQSGLAAVAARLSDGPVISSEVSNV